MSHKSSKNLSTLSKHMTNYTKLQVNQNTITTSLIIPVLTAANPNSTNGEIYVDSTTKHLFIYKNNAWVQVILINYIITSRRGWRLPPSEFRQVSCLVITVFPGGQITSNHFLGILVRMDRLDDHHTNTSRSNFWKISRGGLRLPGRSADLQESDIQQGGQLTLGRSDDLQRAYCPAAQ